MAESTREALQRGLVPGHRRDGQRARRRNLGALPVSEGSNALDTHVRELLRNHHESRRRARRCLAGGAFHLGRRGPVGGEAVNASETKRLTSYYEEDIQRLR